MVLARIRRRRHRRRPRRLRRRDPARAAREEDGDRRALPTFGGVCLNWGCIPSKAVIHAAELQEARSRAPRAFGIGGRQPPAARAPKLQAWKREIVKKLTSGIGMLLKANGVEVVRGPGRLLGLARRGSTSERGRDGGARGEGRSSSRRARGRSSSPSSRGAASGARRRRSSSTRSRAASRSSAAA